MTQGLVRTRTEDDVRLDGVLQLPPSEADRCDEWPADLVMLVHGTSGNFYEPGILEHVAAEVAAAALLDHPLEGNSGPGGGTRIAVSVPLAEPIENQTLNSA